MILFDTILRDGTKVAVEAEEGIRVYRSSDEVEIEWEDLSPLDQQDLEDSAKDGAEDIRRREGDIPRREA
jgi:hypothetical protein